MTIPQAMKEITETDPDIPTQFSNDVGVHGMTHMRAWWPWQQRGVGTWNVIRRVIGVKISGFPYSTGLLFLLLSSCYASTSSSSSPPPPPHLLFSLGCSVFPHHAVTLLLIVHTVSQLTEKLIMAAQAMGGPLLSLLGTALSVSHDCLTPLAFRLCKQKIGFGKRGLLEKGSFQKSPFSRDSREFRDSRDFRGPPDCGK